MTYLMMVHMMFKELAGFHLLDIDLQYNRAFFTLIQCFPDVLVYAESWHLFKPYF